MYASDFDIVHRAYRVLYRRLAIAMILLVVIGAALQLPVPIPDGIAPVLGVGFVASFGVAAGVVLYYRSKERQLETNPLPDRVYLTSKRVILDKGTTWRDVSSIPLVVVGDITIWQSKEMKRIGTSWVYVASIGARSLELREGGERIVAPGVLEVQYLSQTDATHFRSDLVWMSRNAAAGSVSSGAK
jgi:Bacterial PH domain